MVEVIILTVEYSILAYLVLKLIRDIREQFERDE